MNLQAAKIAAGASISVCLPARDEAATIGPIVAAVRDALTGAHGLTNPHGSIGGSPLVDEIVVIDDGSRDDTAAIARDAGARVVAEQDVLPDAGPGTGKGNALWKSLAACSGDLICFLDADLRNFSVDYVSRLVAPLLCSPSTALVKAYYHRSYDGSPTGGGRVTELVARPVLSLLFPKLAGIVQPLGGEYAARREALEVLPFVQGWGVEIGLLIDVAERFGIDAIAQVDLGVREHRNRPVDELAPQALAVLATALRRAGLVESPAPFVELVRASTDGVVDAVPVEIRERPPIITMPSYRALR
jgi:glucosyl-3-phosphoglycerate synthase